ncbi:MAG TPA: hypothetical protein VEB64_17945 [Azospirillaceae bacterium]|nr:hypothetical protein [Azospirillaceae bacterium]
MNEATRTMVEEAYHEAAREAMDRGMSALAAHKEAVVAAAMLLSAVAGVEDEAARAQVVALNLRPESVAA